MTTRINGVEIEERHRQQSYTGEFFSGARGWSDLRGHFVTALSGTTAPARALFKTGVYSNGYDANDTTDWGFHLEHSECKDGVNDKFLHIHAGIASGTTASGANLVITANIGYFKLGVEAGRDMTEIAPFTKTFTATPAQLNAAKGNTMLIGGDTLIGTNGGGTGLFNTSDPNIWITDDDLCVSLVVTTLPTLTGGLSQRIRISHVDIHREVLTGGSPHRIMKDGKFWD
jgi:hypothetical protein